MPKNKDFKRLIRDRASRTGESYSTARAQVLTRTMAPASRPVTVAVTGASGRVAYNLLFRLASGDVFGTDTPVRLRLVDVDEALLALEGVVFELEDCAFPLLTQVDVTSAWYAGFDGASWVLALGAPRLANHVPDAWHATISRRPATEVLDEGWIAETFVPTVQNRGAELIEVSGASSAASAAAAVSDAIRTISRGTAPGEWTTDGAVSNGEYAVPKGLQFGFPVEIHDRTVEVVEGLELGNTQAAMLKRTIEELVAERDLALRLVQSG